MRTLVWWNSKPKIRSSWEDFSSSLQFHLMLKMCGLSISFHGENNECPTFTYKPFHSLCDHNENPYESLSYENHFEILYVSLLIYNWLSNWASLLSHSNWVLVCGLEWDQKRTNKTLALMGFGLFCQLLTSPKLPLIIFNTTIRI